MGRQTKRRTSVIDVSAVHSVTAATLRGSTATPRAETKEAGWARLVASNDKAERPYGPKIDCMKRISTDDIPCRPKVLPRKSYWPQGTLNDVLYWSSSRIRNCMQAIARSSKVHGEEARASRRVGEMVDMRQRLRGGVEPARQSWQKRPIPSGFRANSTEAAGEAHEGSI